MTHRPQKAASRLWILIAFLGCVLVAGLFIDPFAGEPEAAEEPDVPIVAVWNYDHVPEPTDEVLSTTIVRGDLADHAPDSSD